MIYIKKGPEPEAFRQWKEPPLCDLWRDSQGSWPCPAQCPYRPPVEGHCPNTRLWQSLRLVQYQQAHEGRKALRRGSGEQGASCLSPAGGLHLLFLLRLRWRDLRKRGAHGRGAGKGQCDHLHTEAQHEFAGHGKVRCLGILPPLTRGDSLLR